MHKQSMKLTKKSQSYEPCPEFAGQVVCVDVTPLKAIETAYGPKDHFRLVFESPLLRDDGAPYCIWSRNFTPSLHEKAAFAQFLRKWFGRALTSAEEGELETEDLIGRTAEVTIVQEEGRDGQTYSNIALIRPDRTGKPMTPSGRYIRVKDREQKPKDAEFRRAEQAPGNLGDNPNDSWRQTKIHVGKHKGLTLADLDRVSVVALLDRWLPTAHAAPKKTADDKRLITALEAAQAELAEEDNIPMENQAF